MKMYQQAFGKDYPLGISIPEYFEDQSYRNDAGPSFVYVEGHKILKICILPEDPQQREVEDCMRYTLMEMKTLENDDYQEFVKVRFESESSEAFEQIVFDKPKLKQWLSETV